MAFAVRLHALHFTGAACRMAELCAHAYLVTVRTHRWDSIGCLLDIIVEDNALPRL